MILFACKYLRSIVIDIVPFCSIVFINVRFCSIKMFDSVGEKIFFNDR